MKRRPQSLRWPEVDRITLSADWIDDNTFAVQREHRGTLRGSWKFRHTGKNVWQCFDPEYHWKKGTWSFSEKKRTIPDQSLIPQDVERKAREFISQTAKVEPVSAGHPGTASVAQLGNRGATQ